MERVCDGGEEGDVIQNVGGGVWFGAGAQDDDDQPLKKFKCNAYSREKKLLAITYFELTNMPRKNGAPNTPITTTLVAKNLGIDRSSLREWKGLKQRILRMKKGVIRMQG